MLPWSTCCLGPKVRFPSTCDAYQPRFERFRGKGESHQEGQASQGEKNRGRPKKAEERPSAEPTRIERQVNLSAKEALSELSTACDFGVKHDTDGKAYGALRT